MQLEALKLFCDVARYRSFSQAAAAQVPPISQSAASQAVHMLEQRIGVQLIDRSTRPLQLTEVGKIYFEGCLKLLEQYEELEASLRQDPTQRQTTIQVAAIYSVGLGDMGQYIERFEADYPGTRVHVEYLHPDRVYERVEQRAADFGLVSFPRRSRDLVVLPWRDEPMVLACAPSHLLARCRQVRPGQLTGMKYIGFDKELVIRREVDRFLREQGVSVEMVMEFDNIENIKKAIEIGAGIALLPEPTLRREVQAGTLMSVPLSGCQLMRPLGIIHSRHHRLNAIIRRFLDLLRDGASPGPLQSTPANGSPNHASPGSQANGTRRRPRLSRPSRGKV